MSPSVTRTVILWAVAETEGIKTQHATHTVTQQTHLENSIYKHTKSEPTESTPFQPGLHIRTFQWLLYSMTLNNFNNVLNYSNKTTVGASLLVTKSWWICLHIHLNHKFFVPKSNDGNQAFVRVWWALPVLKRYKLIKNLIHNPRFSLFKQKYTLGAKYRRLFSLPK